ncbi:hypothetical protein KSF_086610 [Reticulibacter mediterranei]|uniref:Uncharacterized protein n=1 Tax=Reticulibacter mediterranei TaxID=2778369 RepID=A0A8J3IQX4_9CHLR|nr:hypothetical protein KSF_086610 [Reticulibacter mediterranei]
MRSFGVVLLPLFPVVIDRFLSGAIQTDDREQYQKDDTPIAIDTNSRRLDEKVSS